MIKRCLLYKATPRGSKARSSGRRCREGGETETESGTGTGTRVGREPRIVEQNPIRETDRETERETERNPKRETGRERKWNPNRGNEETRKRGNDETRKRGNEETRKRGNEEMMKDQNIGCCIPIYTRGVCWPLYTQDRLTTQISIPVRRPPDLYIVLVHFHAIPNPYLRNRASPAA